ncbi:succinate dehydrogenase cytochrome b560 subunit [Gautieria morchelliformis]|nr:succinate dehydrogenase cytochrome b560 subunit [Gautieria morchelliformis]
MMSTRALGLTSALRNRAFTSRTATLELGPLLTSVTALVCCRTIQIQSLPSSASQEILNSQRLRRPSSPHFTIYQPQLTWLGSIANRITGSALSVLLYGFSLSYLILPAVGMPFDGSQFVDFVHSLPEWVKYVNKVLLAAPFAFHSWNGIRHLLWDTGRFLSVKGAYATGYAVLGATAITTVGLLFV